MRTGYLREQEIALRHGCAPGGLIIRLGVEESFAEGVKIISDGNNAGLQVDRMLYSCKPSLLLYPEGKSVVVHESWRRTGGGEVIQQWAAFASLKLGKEEVMLKSYQITDEKDFVLTFVRTIGEPWPKPEVKFEHNLAEGNMAHAARIGGLLKLAS
jgi:hypothetical protein